MKIFVSQPMRGREAREIKLERKRIEAYLREKYGSEVEILSSFVEKFEDRGSLWYLGRSIQILSEADYIFILMQQEDPTSKVGDELRPT